MKISDFKIIGWNAHALAICPSPKCKNNRYIEFSEIITFAELESALKTHIKKVHRDGK